MAHLVLLRTTTLEKLLMKRKPQCKLAGYSYVKVESGLCGSSEICITFLQFHLHPDVIYNRKKVYNRKISIGFISIGKCSNPVPLNYVCIHHQSRPWLSISNTNVNVWSLNLLALYVWRCPWRCVLLVSHFPSVIKVMLLMFRWQRRKQSRAHHAVNILYICFWFSFISVELQLIILRNVSNLAYCLTTMSLQLKCRFPRGLKPRCVFLLCSAV